MKMQLFRCDVCRQHVLLEEPVVSYSNFYACPYCAPRDSLTNLLRPLPSGEERTVLEQVDLGRGGRRVGVH